MKKVPIVIGILLIAVILVANFWPNIKRTTYILSEKECDLLFSRTPQEFIDTIDEIIWTKDFCTSAKIKGKNLILVLNEKQKKEWQQNCDTAIDRAKKQGTVFSSDYSKMTIYTTKETVIDDVAVSLMSAQSCCVKQLLNDRDVKDIQVNVKVINKSNNKVLHETAITIDSNINFDSNNFIWD